MFLGLCHIWLCMQRKYVYHKLCFLFYFHWQLETIPTLSSLPRLPARPASSHKTEAPGRDRHHWQIPSLPRDNPSWWPSLPVLPAVSNQNRWLLRSHIFSSGMTTLHQQHTEMGKRSYVVVVARSKGGWAWTFPIKWNLKQQHKYEKYSSSTENFSRLQQEV